MFGTANRYMTLDAWVLASIVQLATDRFCRRFVNHTVDPTGRQYDQMTQAARSGQANIAEGSSRGQTSKKTEMQLLDVARASLAELNGDFTFWLMRAKNIPWGSQAAESQAILTQHLDRPNYQGDWTRASCAHILRQQERFSQWLDSDNDVVVANAIIILIGRTINAINHLLEQKVEDFKTTGGFSEKLSKARLEARDAVELKDSPLCPICGKPMRKRLAKKGRNAGRPFWSCSGYPDCTGTREYKGE